MTVRDGVNDACVGQKTLYRHVQTQDLSGFKVALAWRLKRHDVDQRSEEHNEVFTERDTKPARLAESMALLSDEGSRKCARLRR